PQSTPSPYTTLFRSAATQDRGRSGERIARDDRAARAARLHPGSADGALCAAVRSDVHYRVRLGRRLLGERLAASTARRRGPRRAFLAAAFLVDRARV